MPCSTCWSQDSPAVEAPRSPPSQQNEAKKLDAGRSSVGFGGVSEYRSYELSDREKSDKVAAAAAPLAAAEQVRAANQDRSSFPGTIYCYNGVRGRALEHSISALVFLRKLSLRHARGGAPHERQR